MAIGVKEIRELFDSWMELILSGHGDVDLFEFARNNLVVHDLEFQELIECLIGLSRFSLNSSGGQFYFEEHRLVWAWAFQILCVSGFPKAPIDRDDLAYRFNLATLANLVLVPGSFAARSICHTRRDPVQYMVASSDRLLEYVAFPSLEATCKRALPAHFAMSGMVVQGYSVTSKSGLRSFKRSAGKTCSSLEELLWVLYDNVSMEHQLVFDRFDEIFNVLGKNKHFFGVIFDWRNDSLHGDESSSIAALLVNLLLVIGLFSVKDSYEKDASRVRQSMLHKRTYCATTLHFYPPP